MRTPARMRDFLQTGPWTEHGPGCYPLSRLTEGKLMLSKLRELFATQGDARSGQAAPDEAERLRIATCVILLETARIDEEFSAEEKDHILQTLVRRFSLSEDDAHELMEASSESRRESVDLWSFTHQVNEACGTEEKVHIIEEVWRVIYADGTLDGHEDYLVHKLAKLLNLTHPQLIQAKVKVLDERRNEV